MQARRWRMIWGSITVAWTPQLRTWRSISYKLLSVMVRRERPSGRSVSCWRRQIQEEEQTRGRKVLYYYRDQATIQEIVNLSALEAKPGEPPAFPPGGYASDIPPWETRFTQSQLEWAFYDKFALHDKKGVGFFVAFVADGS